MFVGTYQYRVDEKGRVPIPPAFRRALTEGGYLTPGAEGCITVYTGARFDEIGRSLQTAGLPNESIRALNRRLFSTASELKLDAQGRATLSPELRQYAGIGDTAIVVGINDCAEIWSPEKWQSQEPRREQAWQVIENLEEKGRQP